MKTDVSVPAESNKQNKLEKNLFFVGILEVTDEKSRIRIRKSSVRIQDPDPYKNVTDPEHCWQAFVLHEKKRVNALWTC